MNLYYVRLPYDYLCSCCNSTYDSYIVAIVRADTEANAARIAATKIDNDSALSITPSFGFATVTKLDLSKDVHILED